MKCVTHDSEFDPKYPEVRICTTAVILSAKTEDGRTFADLLTKWGFTEPEWKLGECVVAE